MACGINPVFKMLKKKQSSQAIWCFFVYMHACIHLQSGLLCCSFGVREDLRNLKADANQNWEVLVLVFMGEGFQFNIRFLKSIIYLF